MEASQIGADSYPIDGDRILKLVPLEKLSKLPKGTKLISIVGKEVEVGKDDLDLETRMFQRSKYGELVKVIDVPVIKGKLVVASKVTKNRPYKEEKSYGKPKKVQKKH